MKGKQIASLIMLFVMMMGLLTGCGETQNTVDTSDTTNKQNSSNTEDVPTEVGDEILVAADFRRDTFYSRTSNIESAGTVYYISNSGDNNNDGLSPETAWATLDRAFKT